MLTGVSHIWFFVDDLDRARQFWCDQLGFPLDGVDAGENVTVRVGDVIVGLHLPYPGMEDLPPSLRCTPTLQFTGSPEDLVARLRDAGVGVMDPTTEEWGTYIQAFDPSGNALGFWQPPS